MSFAIDNESTLRSIVLVRTTFRWIVLFLTNNKLSWWCKCRLVEFLSLTVNPAISWIDMRKSLGESVSIASYVLSARWEKEKFAVYVATDYNDILKWGTSFSIRYSIIQLGVSNLIQFSQGNSVRNIGLMVGLKLPLLTKSQTGKNRIF